MERQQIRFRLWGGSAGRERGEGARERWSGYRVLAVAVSDVIRSLIRPAHARRTAARSRKRGKHGRLTDFQKRIFAERASNIARARAPRADTRRIKRRRFVTAMRATVSGPLPALRPARQPFSENLISTAIRCGSGHEFVKTRHYRSCGNAIIQLSRVSGRGRQGWKGPPEERKRKSRSFRMSSPSLSLLLQLLIGPCPLFQPVLCDIRVQRTALVSMAKVILRT